MFTWFRAPTTQSCDSAMSMGMLICMHSTSVRIDSSTHEELKRLAAELHTTVGNTVALAVRALRQDRVGGELSAPLRDDEAAWLDADLG
jgi:predicted transcriptional regulator